MATDSTQRSPSGFGTFVWALFYFFVFTVAVLLLMWTFGPKSGVAYEDKRGDERLKLREKVVSEANLKLNTVGLVDALTLEDLCGRAHRAGIAGRATEYSDFEI